MNTTQIMGIVRDLLKVLGVFAIAYGYVDEGTWEMIVGAVVTLSASAWSWYTNKTSTMIAAVAQTDDVKKVVTTATIANADPSPKVVAK